ncbi:hypothetical protein ScPMuIL_002800 [Solemya velum]
MGLLSGIGRLVIIVLNIIFVILSLGLLVSGLMARFATDTTDIFIAAAEDTINEQLDNTMGNSGQKVNLDLTDILIGVAIGLIVSGIVLGTIAMLGCCGACYRWKTILLIYAVILVIILIGEAVVVGLFLGSPDTIKDPMKASLKEGIAKYEGMDGRNLESIAWNIIMTQFKCCGAKNYKDFKDAPNWDSSPVFTASGYSSTANIDMPLVCCKMGWITQHKSVDCAREASVNDANNYKNVGCVDTIWDMIFGNKPIMYGAFAGALGFELLLIALTLLIFFENDDKIGAMG